MNIYFKMSQFQRDAKMHTYTNLKFFKGEFHGEVEL